MFTIRTSAERQIYVDTLCALARDAKHQGNAAAFQFIAAYLPGLIPDADMDATLAALEPEREARVVRVSLLDAPKAEPEPEGDALSDDALAELEAAAKPNPAAAVSYRPPLRQSEALQW